MAALVGIDNLEVLTLTIMEKSRKKIGSTPPTYEVMPIEVGADMMSWRDNVQIQDIGHGFWRVGAIGDGNCLLHSFMTATSPTYRMQDTATRQHIVDTFRKVLVSRMDDIRDRMDELYFEVGGASVLEDSLAILKKKRDELGLEVAPAIARLYGFNFLAIAIDDSLKWRPFCQTMRGFDPEAPTVLIHYMGAGANFDESKHGFSEAGHYEVIVRPVIVAAAAAEEAPAAPAGGAGRGSARLRTKTKAASPTGDMTQFDEVRTSYMLTTGDLGYVLALFEKECKSDPAYVHPLEREGGPRRTASGRIITGSSGSRHTVKRTASGRTVSGSSETRRRKHAAGGKRSSSGGGGRAPTPHWG